MAHVRSLLLYRRFPVHASPFSVLPREVKECAARKPHKPVFNDVVRTALEHFRGSSPSKSDESTNVYARAPNKQYHTNKLASRTNAYDRDASAADAYIYTGLQAALRHPPPPRTCVCVCPCTVATSSLQHSHWEGCSVSGSKWGNRGC